MVRQFVTAMLGEFGNQVLRFYVENSLAINGMVVLYGLFLLLAHLNLRRIEASALTDIRQNLEQQDPAARRQYTSQGAAPGFSWQEIIDQVSFFPFIARGNSLVPRRTRPDGVERLIPLAKLVQKAASDETQAEGA